MSSNTYSGKFITFEGSDGSGKTTAINNTVAYLKEQGFDVLVTREPGGSFVAEQIRDLLLDKNNNIPPRAEALLYSAARAQHLTDTVIPALTAGKIVICDRYIDSSLAYQGFARGLGFDEILRINEFAMDGHMPNLTLFFDVPPTIAMERVKNRTEEMNRLDLEKLSFHERVYNGYVELTKIFKDRIRVVDATQSIESVSNQTIEVITNFLK